MDGVTGYVLAGGRSSRMGRDKATMLLHGRTLIERAVEKLRSVTESVCIVGGRPDLASYARVTPDVREGYGPLGGLEAAFADCGTDWALLIAVDMPFVPAGVLGWLIDGVRARTGVRAAMFVTDSLPQPTVSLVHRDLSPFVTSALNRSELKLAPVLRAAAAELAGQSGVSAEEALWMPDGRDDSIRPHVTVSEWHRRGRWFANLNTPEEFALAAAEAGLLD